MKILLIDADSRIPNLALMKLSAHHKSLGDDVGFHISDPDLIYMSIIYSKHRYMADAVRHMYPGVKICAGGTGRSMSSKLPRNDCIMPDYTLYPSSDYSLGFTTRGCIRDCRFCRFHGYLSPVAKYELEMSGNNVTWEHGCWIITARGDSE